MSKVNYCLAKREKCKKFFAFPSEQRQKDQKSYKFFIQPQFWVVETPLLKTGAGWKLFLNSLVLVKQN